MTKLYLRTDEGWKDKANGYPFLCELQEDLAGLGLIKLNGKYYAVYSIDYVNNMAVVTKVNLVKEPGTLSYEQDLTCPYCQEKIYDAWELDDCSNDYECPKCGGIFSYEKEIEVTYSSSPVTPPNFIIATEKTTLS